MFIKIKDIILVVSTSEKKSGIKKPQCLIKYDISNGRFNDQNELYLNTGAIRLRPHRYKPLVVSVQITGKFDKKAGTVVVNAECEHNAAGHICVKVVGYSLVAILTTFKEAGISPEVHRICLK